MTPGAHVNHAREMNAMETQSVYLIRRAVATAICAAAIGAPALAEMSTGAAYIAGHRFGQLYYAASACGGTITKAGLGMAAGFRAEDPGAFARGNLDGLIDAAALDDDEGVCAAMEHLYGRLGVRAKGLWGQGR